jgi:hypothetical protein
MLLLAYLAVVRPILLAYDTRQQELAERELRLAHLRRVAAAGTLYQQALDTLRKTANLEQAYFVGERDSIIAADLQNLVKTVVRETGGTLQSTQVLPAAAVTGFQRIGVRVKIVSDTDSLYNTLVRLDQHTPFLFVDDLNVALKTRRNRKGVSENHLETEMTVFAYMRPA